MARAVDILRSDETLLAAFLLRVAAETGSAAFTDENISRFLLWFTVHGRHEHQHVSFTPDYLAFLAAPLPPYPSRLAAYVLVSRPDLQRAFGQDVDRYLAWYYEAGLRELRLLPFVSFAEREFLRAPHPRPLADGQPQSRAARYALLRDPELARRLASARPADRAGLAAIGPAATADPIEPWAPRAAPRDRADLPGCNVVGFADGVLGIGEDARAIATVLGHAGVPRCIYNLALPASGATSQRAPFEALYSDRPLFPVNIFALTAFETARLKAQQGSNLFAGRYNIGYWPWELTTLPEDWRFVFGLVDEIWASSHFLVEVYRGLTDKPVHYVPPYLNSLEVARVDLSPFGLGADDIVFLTMLDFNSYVARKNPEAAVSAFQRAFPNRAGAERMVIKTLNAHAHPERLAALEARLGDDDRFVLIDGSFSRAELCGLIAASDCFVSLHRAEGFGRAIAEAMQLETPVVATNWSGNTSFIDKTTGYVVNFTLRPVEPGEYVFWEGSQWAEPSIVDAARKLRVVRRQLMRNGNLRDRAKARIQAQYGLDAVTEAVVERLGEINSTRAG